MLNLRHSLSTALVAARAAGLASWQAGLNVNRILAAGLDGAFGWPAKSGLHRAAGGIRCCVTARAGVEGTHASGKTTLTHALAAHYRERGIHVATVEEPARHSPFIEEIVVHGKGQFDLETEVDLFAAQLSAQLRAARQHTMIICDKTIANVLAYARLVLTDPAGQPGSRRPGRDGTRSAGPGHPPMTWCFYCCDRRPAPARRPLPLQGPGPAAGRRPGRPLDLRQRPASASSTSRPA